MTAPQTIQRHDALVEDVEWLLAAREWPPHIASRLGYASPDNLARHLNRIGRNDLARRVDSREWRGVA